ncbi:IclR family transcriptional regulator [Bradyrhizobium septentrionale]|uniref:Helix-turn-helix domain-containing protein n=1 Tax=Bradyrhizobium septentrionale TaxID=1404411 RepID=A0A973W6Q6_9BRAD|nr:helix-turn-helix domain-containing protein [Bradyrhizobium septentrionale]UGY17259.1 helix-turn-helix domain-containing protein [Bradyrhizobium septentrionale]UGY26003.1 helix-turn-helix domain-containing protein [Bradyrhizobium septentrionale]
MPNSNKTAIVKSAMRTFAVLEFFRETKRAASVTEISSALEMPQSSTSVLLSSLVELNYLEYDRQTRRFIPSYRVNLLGDWIRRSPFRDAKLTDLMEELWTATGGETVMLGQQAGAAGMQYLHVVRSGYQLQFITHAGQIRPMVRTALGHVLLSQMPNTKIRGIIRRNNSEEPSQSARVRESAFLEEVERIRRRGFSESSGRTTPGANTIGMLVPLPRRRAPLAIGIGGPIERIAAKRARIIEVMQSRLKKLANEARPGFVEK